MPAETRSLADDVIAITGATSGIGAATARQLVASGAKVALGARHGDRLAAMVEELGADNAVGVVRTRGCPPTTPPSSTRRRTASGS